MLIPRQRPTKNLDPCPSTTPPQQTPHTLLTPLSNNLLQLISPPPPPPLPHQQLPHTIQVPFPNPPSPLPLPFLQQSPRTDTLGRIYTYEIHAIFGPADSGDVEVEETCAFEVVRDEGYVGGVVVGEAAEEEEGEEGVLVGVGRIGFGMEGVLVRGKGEVGLKGKSEVLWCGGIRCYFETFLGLGES